MVKSDCLRQKGSLLAASEFFDCALLQNILRCDIIFIMETAKEKNRLTFKNSQYFDVEKTLDCGQLFRFKKVSTVCFEVTASDKFCRIETGAEETVIHTDSPDFFFNYFDLGTDYGDIFNKLSIFPELESALVCGRGIRILNQDPFETIVSFIISANNNIPRIKGIIERLCSAFGEKKDDYNAFVSKERFKNMTVSDFSILRAGFREGYLYADKDIITNESYLERIKTCSAADAEKELLSLKGVGPKVASCIMLFALKQTGSFPVDTWIFKANRTEELDTPEKVRRFFMQRYGALAGYAQQFIFYSKRNLGL